MAAGFVLDASVALAFCFEDEAERKYATEVLETLAETEAIVPQIWRLEVANALLTAERRRRSTPEESSQSWRILNDMAITAEQAAPGTVFATLLPLARAQGLSVYDASYLDLAMREGLPLATMDDKLAKAAKKCGVARFQPGKSRD